MYVVLRASSPVQPNTEDRVGFVVMVEIVGAFVIVASTRSAPATRRLGETPLIVDVEFL